MDISVVIPLYNEEESLSELHAWIKRVMDANGYSYEIIFVNDGYALEETIRYVMGLIDGVITRRETE